MIIVHLPLDLADQFKLSPILSITASDLGALIGELDHQRPGLASWLVESNGRFREHLSIFVDGRRLPTQSVACGAITAGTDVWIMRAVSGG